MNEPNLDLKPESPPEEMKENGAALEAEGAAVGLVEVIETEDEGKDPVIQTPLVEVKNLYKEFDETVAIAGISFEIYPGEIFGFIGPNGAGKTTTIKILSTLLDPTSGNLTIDGLDVIEEPEKVRRIIGYMPDEFGVYRGITIWEYMDFFAGAYRVPRSKRKGVIEGVLELTDLAVHRNRHVTTLSKGMRQRLCLAKTLIHDPKFLILDEPASAMDPRARIELRALLKELQTMGKTILISSHILTELSDVCTSFGVLEKGKILRSGRLGGGTVIENEEEKPALKFKLKFHSACPEAYAVLQNCPEVLSHQFVTPEENEIELEFTEDPSQFYKVIKLLVDRSFPLLTVEAENEDLERVFLEVTRGDLQ